MTYSTSKVCDDIGSLEWVPITALREIANISLIILYNDNVMKIRDKIQTTFSSAKSITSKTTRFPEDGTYCCVNHPSLRDNFADMLYIAQSPDLRYTDVPALREKFLSSLNKLSKVVHSLNESTKTMDGLFNRKTFESTFQITWESTDN